LQRNPINGKLTQQKLQIHEKAKKETKTNIMRNEELQGLVKREHTV
jgi:hypothetical protein